MVVAATVSAQETFPGGIVYGPKAAFHIAAPEGWVLDNQAGAEQGLPCVLYPKVPTWAGRHAPSSSKQKSPAPNLKKSMTSWRRRSKKCKRCTAHRNKKLSREKRATAKAFFISRYPPAKSYFPVGARRLHPTPESSRLHRFLGQRRIELSQIFARANGSAEIFCIPRAESRVQTIISILAESAITRAQQSAEDT